VAAAYAAAPSYLERCPPELAADFAHIPEAEEAAEGQAEDAC
jgi:hypothetical protein